MKKSFLAIALIATVIAGCQQDVHGPVVPDIPDTVVFEAETEELNAPTKTSMNSNRSVIWSEGDGLSIFQGCTWADKYIVASGVGTPNATFSKVVTSDFTGGTETTFGVNVAFYPYEADLICTAEYDTDDNVTSYQIANVTIPSEQTYAENSFPNGAFPMVALTSSTDDKGLKFRNVCGVMKFNIIGSGIVKSVVLKGNSNESLSGNATVRVYPDNVTVPTIEMAEDASKTITLNCGDGVQLSDTPTAFMMAVPPTAFEGGFTVLVNAVDTDGTGFVSELVTTNANNSVNRSRIRNMPVLGVGESDAMTAEGATDLSTSATANCYIVSAAGKYIFPTVKGNSSTSVGNVFYCDVLWESYGTAETISEDALIAKAFYSEDKIIFQTAETFREGNAVIAAKDAGGKILWTWHIWMVSKEQYEIGDSMEEYTYGNDGVLMDRNLGAISRAQLNVGTLGLLYQWGRKDPFLGSSITKEANNHLTAAPSTMTWPSAVESTESTGTIQYTIENPTTYIYTTDFSGDWLYNWDDEESLTRWDSDKTIYDPCPPGWRVPDNDVWADFNDELHRFDPDYTKAYGAKFQVSINDSATTTWYPYSGYIVGYNPSDASSLGKLSAVGTYGYYWSATHDGINAAKALMFYDTTTDVAATFNIAQGCSVRCMKIQ